ncbi:MAG: ABC transporter ATP-binding protein [Elusimicrobia bacterium]|nr:ABC transporter ATP-binding protein [Elusimicrobiota bacterium]
MTDKALMLRDVSKTFSEGGCMIEVIRQVSLKFSSGKWYTIYGPSGSGKTTLLNIIGGIERPDAGSVLFGDTDIYAMNDEKLSRWRNVRIGFVFQFFNLISELDVEKNISLPIKIYNLKQDRKWISAVIDILRIGNLLKRKTSTLSGGEKQRVAIARAVINRPDFILADEPTGNLDSDNSANVISLMKRLHDESGVGIILATHEKELIETGECRFKLSDGKIREKGE